MAAPVALQAAPRADKVDLNLPAVGMACPVGTPVNCFTVPANPATGRYLNVASFFDRRELSLGTHYFLKFFENTSGAALDIAGLGMYVTSSSGSSRTLSAVGVLKTSRANPTLPLPEDLLELQVVGIAGEATGTETCAEFNSAIRLSAEESAWLVVRFPPGAIGTFIGLLVDDDATDEDCDFMTPDNGQMYFRPDPRSGPAFDWAITAYTQSVTSKETTVDIIDWSNFKVLYRNSGPASAK